MLVFLLFFLSASLAIPLNHTLPQLGIQPGDSFTEVINGVERTCYWAGTSPWCNGSCPEHDFDEVDRRIYKYIPDDVCWDLPWDRCVNDPYFGQACFFTTKAKCCRKIKITLPKDL